MIFGFFENSFVLSAAGAPDILRYLKSLLEINEP